MPDIERLESAMDRLQEAHFFLHGLEQYYHFANAFRWHLNAFTRALKEVPQLISMGWQNEEGFPAWYRPKREALSADPLIRHLSLQRDFVVHRGMLRPASSAFLGITEGRGIKLGMRVPVDPMLNSDELMETFVRANRAQADPFGFLNQADEQTLPCIERRWALPEFPGEELVDLCARAWVTVAELMREVYQWGETELAPPGLECRHDAQAVQLRAYSRQALDRDEFRGFPVPKPGGRVPPQP